MDIIRIVLALPAQIEFLTYQLDIKLAFLNKKLEKEVYVEQPEGYV